MKVKVLRAYQDKDSKEFHKFGDEPYEIKDNARAKELIEAGYVVECPDDKSGTLKAEITALKAESAALKKENADLKAEIIELKAVIEKAAAADLK